MHVFGLKPMSDPLHLVCCKACKKPLKLSRYAAHAELCKSLNSVEEIMPELIGGTGPKKPPRKEKKKKSLTTSTTTSVGLQQRFENRNATAASEFNSRNSPCVDGTLVMDNSACFSPGYTEHSTTGPTPPPTKHRKIVAAKGPRIQDHSETSSGVTKTLCTSTQQALKCKKYPNGSSVKSEKTCDDISGSQMSSQVQSCYLPSKVIINGDATKLDVPVPVAPLATKIFYSQRNRRIRSAITHLYYESSTKEPSASAVKQQVLHSTATSSHSLFPKNVCKEQSDYQQEKTEKPDEILGESSEVSESGGCTPTMNCPNQFSVKNVVGPHKNPTGLTRTSYISTNHYSFAGNSGNPLGTIQQPKESVPVT